MCFSYIFLIIVGFFKCENNIKKIKEEKVSTKNEVVIHPVIEVPGVGASRLEIFLNKSQRSPRWYCKKKSDPSVFWV